MKRYRNIDVDYGVNAEIMESFERERERQRMEEELANTNQEAFEIEEDEIFGQQVFETEEMAETADFIELD